MNRYFLSRVFCIFSLLTSPPTKPKIFTNFLYREKACWSLVCVDHQLSNHFLYLLLFVCVCLDDYMCPVCAGDLGG